MQTHTDRPEVTPPARDERPPGPRGLAILGELRNMGGPDSLDRYLEMRERYGDLIYLKVASKRIYVLFGADQLHHILVRNQKNYAKGMAYDGFRMLVGQGLVTSEGDLWKRQRRIMQPQFTAKAVTKTAQMMAEITGNMLDRWSEASERGENLEMDLEMMRLTMGIIGRAMFSIDIDAKAAEVGSAFQAAFGFLPARTMNPLVPMGLPLPSHRRFRKDLALIDAFVAAQIEISRKDGAEDNILSVLLRARDEETGEGMDAEQLRDEVVTLMFAGFETTARTLTWAWYMLGQHPEVQGKLQEEADRVLAGRPAAIADFPNLTYTRMVIDETLRLYPPTPLLARESIAIDEIDGYVIPGGSMMVLVPYVVHRSEEFWPNPDRFDPERFRPELNAARPIQAYLPFALGPRTCLGNHFALQEMVCALAMAASRFEMKPASEAEIGTEFAGTLRPDKPLFMKAIARN